MTQKYPDEVKWIDTGHARDAKRNERWRRGVGAPFVANFAPMHDGVLDEIMVVSWNIHVGSADTLLFIEHLREGRFTGGVPVRDFVLLAQEAFRSNGTVPDPMPADANTARPILYADSKGDRHSADDVAKSAKLFVAYAPSMRNGPLANPKTGKCEDRGNAIFSTRPLLNVTAIELPLLHQRRVAVLGHVIATTSRGNAVDLQLASIHFDLKATPWGRASQARAVIKAADAPACIVAGDLNILPVLEPTFSVLADSFPQSTFTDQSVTHVAAMNRRIDFQFFRFPGTWHATPYVRIPDLYGSDHYPLLSSIRFHSAKP